MAMVAAPPVSNPSVQPLRPSLPWLSVVTERRWVCWLCLFCYCVWLFFYGLPRGELYRTESLRAIIAAEFLRSGNWIVPTLYGEPLFTKPPGMYAAIALASLPAGGVSESTARLPSAIAATLTVFLFYWYFGHQLGRPAGLVAALILPMSFLWLDKSMAAEIDMLQAFWVSASILFFMRGLEVMEDRERRMKDRGSPDAPKVEYRRFTFPGRENIPPLIRQDSAVAKPKQTDSSIVDSRSSILDPPSSLWFWWIAALLCVAGGVLTKWTGAAFFYGTVIPLLWWRGQLRLLWGRHHLVCAGIAAGICLAWVVAAVTMTGWQEFYGTVSREALMRLSPSHHHRPYPWRESLVHPFRLLAAGLPCSAFALLTLRPGFATIWDPKARRLLQGLHCWVWPNMLFWSVIPEHATRHSFPLFPGLAGLSAMVWVAWLRGYRLPNWKFAFGNLHFAIPFAKKMQTASLSMARVFLGLIFVWLVVKLVFVEAVLPRRNPARQPKEKGEQLAALVPANNVLYLFQLKDEGIMFYYGRTVRRLPGPAQLPSSDRGLYCILDETEWKNWADTRPVETLLKMPDEQGDPIFLVRVEPVVR
ncbi:MAG TPA: glycosyltransferase family 39 protein [Gemmataceae bacterium]|nr:glycosyltransferase family 39 protein [Gemmataceae bacterium]